MPVKYPIRQYSAITWFKKETAHSMINFPKVIGCKTKLFSDVFSCLYSAFSFYGSICHSNDQMNHLVVNYFEAKLKFTR